MENEKEEKCIRCDKPAFQFVETRVQGKVFVRTALFCNSCTKKAKIRKTRRRV